MSARLRQIGPGIVVAATGLGAGDIIAAAVAGAQFGTVLLWAVVLGGVLKYVLNEGLGRWQLVTGKTLLEGWVDHLHPALSWYFLAYLLLWSFMVAGAMMAATGLAAHALFPVLPVSAWAILHSLLALLLVISGGYRLLETGMKLFVGLMFISVIWCALLVLPDAADILGGLLLPRVPAGSLPFVLGVIGGVGGSVTVMSYGYWMQEVGWRGPGRLPLMRLDLRVAYALTVLFGMAIIIVAAGVDAEVVTGNTLALAIADEMASSAGEPAKWLFLVGFWGAVFSSMLGVWQGVPYLFADFVYYQRRRRAREQAPEGRAASVQRQQDAHGAAAIRASLAYRGYLCYLAIPPMLLLILGRPVWVVVAYAVAGAFFMPLLAALLLYMNSARRWLAEEVNSLWHRLGLALCLLLFAALAINELWG